MSQAGALESRVLRELHAPSRVQSEALVAAIHERFGGQIAAILFYGSCRRTGDASGLLDLYVLHDGYRHVHKRRLSAALNWLLPPNVVQITAGGGADRLRAKVAIISRRQFTRRMRPEALDTTLWTRFCQPASLLHARDPDVERWVAVAVAEGMRTAVTWANQLCALGADVASRWRNLFWRTYRLELRPEAQDRPALLHDSNVEWFDEVMRLAQVERGDTVPLCWAPRRIFGKPLNILRLAKAAFTYDGGADYLVDKLQAHAGLTIVLSSWQRRHSLLAAPALIWGARRVIRHSA